MGENRPTLAIQRLADRQHGNVTRVQLLALGVGPKTIESWLRRGFLHQVHSGVYAVGRPAKTALERAAAAVLACGDGALLSHHSALALWGFAERWPARMHVTVALDRRPAGIAVHRSRTIARPDVRTHLGIHVTSPARALLDSAPTMKPRALTRAVNDALRSPFLTQAQLTEVVRRCAWHPGAKLLRPFVETPTGPTRSDFEDLFLKFCERFGLPRPLVNTVIAGHEVDALFPAERVIVELDSWGFHRDRHAFETDRDRDADTAALGYITIRITWERLIRSPEREAARLKAILATRASAPVARSAPLT